MLKTLQRLIFAALLLHIPAALASPSAPTPEKVAQALVNPHGANWPSIVHSDADSAAVAAILKEFVANPIAVDRLKLHVGTPVVQNRALAEFGHFATSPEGFPQPGSIDLYRSILDSDTRSSEDSRRRISLLESLASAANPEATLLLIEAVSGRFESSSDSLALKHLMRVFNDPPLARRLRSPSWRAAAERALRSVLLWSRSDSADDYARRLLGEARATIADFISGTPHSVEANIRISPESQARPQVAGLSDPIPAPVLAETGTASELDDQSISMPDDSARELSQERSSDGSFKWIAALLVGCILAVGLLLRRI